MGNVALYNGKLCPHRDSHKAVCITSQIALMRQFQLVWTSYLWFSAELFTVIGREDWATVKSQDQLFQTSAYYTSCSVALTARNRFLHAFIVTFVSSLHAAGTYPKSKFHEAIHDVANFLHSSLLWYHKPVPYLNGIIGNCLKWVQVNTFLTSIILICGQEGHG